MKEYRNTEIVKAIQWDGSNAAEIEKMVRSEAMGTVIRRGNTLLIDTAFSDIYAEIGDYLIFKGTSVWCYDEEKFKKSYELIEKSEI